MPPENIRKFLVFGFLIFLEGVENINDMKCVNAVRIKTPNWKQVTLHNLIKAHGRLFLSEIQDIQGGRSY